MFQALARSWVSTRIKVCSATTPLNPTRPQSVLKRVCSFDFLRSSREKPPLGYEPICPISIPDMNNIKVTQQHLTPPHKRNRRVSCLVKLFICSCVKPRMSLRLPTINKRKTSFRKSIDIKHYTKTFLHHKQQKKKIDASHACKIFK